MTDNPKNYENLDDNEDLPIEELEPATRDRMIADSEVGLDDLGGRFVRNPKVGETVIFTVARVRKASKDLEVVNPKTGGKIRTALTNVDYKYEVDTMDDRVFTVSKWEVWGKLKAIWLKLANGDKGFTLRGKAILVKHVKSGLADKAGDNYLVAVRRDDGQFYALGRQSNEWELVEGVDDEV